MSPLFNLIAFVIMSLTVSATPSLRQDSLLMSEKLREATIKNQTMFDEAQQSIRTDETLSNFSVSNAAATQDIASSYLVFSLYADASCSTLTSGLLTPLDMCLSVYSGIFTYSSVDKSVTVISYGDSKCTGAPTVSYQYATVSDTCTKVGSDGQFYKYSLTSSFRALNTDAFVVT